VQKKFELINKKLNISNTEIVTKLSLIWVVYGIRKILILDLWVRKAPDPVSGSATLSIWQSYGN
jgi:hypothetical protein